MSAPPLSPLPFPPGVTSRQLDTRPIGLSFHILEAGYTPDRNRPLIVLLHGFPEIAFSWRKVMPLLANAGCYVVAPDQRGYGRATGWDNRDFANVDLNSFSVTNLIRDVIVLVHALGYQSVRCLVGHDFGAASAAFCALARPDIFQSVVLMSHPFKKVQSLPSFHTSPQVTEAPKGEQPPAASDIHSDLASLSRKHYKWYYSTQPASSEMTNPPNGLHEFLRGYFHLKSASWSKNTPHPLTSWTASELAKMPNYYVMPLNATMPEAIAADMAQEDPSALQDSQSWLPDSDLAVYVSEHGRNSFQGALNWYRVFTNSDPAAAGIRDVDLFAGKWMECPIAYISGRQDWGTYQVPGAVEAMMTKDVCTDFRGMTLVDGAGHWIPLEKPEEVVSGILEMIRSLE
ncbi:microsomal epoxide hydrolase [Blastomyces dermatitidis ER-3]|uniref:Microsomal epoxide hydrolase n=1 Tax=Ajellomyces dermatitidis (strain ER-3 / ATCC MYA-2586) TaxID=559297 RepID=A0ABP2EY02_AJEDR|nr:microsomal epoxide hydrolase [Blastomyces dermatitidis ER-3]EEQ89071.1 microsomal epoxide hydrolase [Blastomyces dermatitidis ER-3]